MVLVSPTGGLDAADFTDTIYNVVNPNLGASSDSVILGQAYAGQRIRVAFVVSSGYMVLSNVAVNNSTATPVVSLTAPEAVRTGDSVRFSASPGNCAQSGLTFSWHSTLLDSSMVTIDAMLTVVYPYAGIDTITVVVSNIYGNDSEVAVVKVADCSPIVALPWIEDFESVPATVANAVGSLPPCWDYLWSGMGAADAPHVITAGGYQYISSLSGNALFMAAGNMPGGYSDQAEVVMQSFAESLHNLAIAFDYRFENADRGVLQVGYYSDTAFTAVQTMIPHDVSSRRDTVRFADCDGTIALRWSYGSNYYYYAVLIDNIEVFIDSSAIIDTLPVVPDTVWLTVSIEWDTTMGIVIGGGTYLDSSIVTISATAFDGYHFEQWNDGDTHAMRQILVTSDTILTAHFATDTLPIPDTLWRSVTISSNEENACETYGSGQYMDGDTVEIGYAMHDTAAESGHWQFRGWNDGPSENPRQIIITSDTTIVALFEWVADSTEGIGDIGENGTTSTPTTVRLS